MAHTRRGRKYGQAAAGAAGLLVIGAATAGGAMAATSQAAAGPSWRIVKSVRTGSEGQFTAVTATGRTTGWAFEGSDFNAAPAAYQFSGSNWRKVSLPANKDEQIVTAAATSPSDVWAFAQGFGTPSRVLKYNGRGWSVVKTFTGEIADATVLASNDVWVYGEKGISGFQPALGVWHYNGSTWRQVSKSIQGGSAVSATSAWGFNGVDVEHWNGAKWTATSVKSLLPAKNRSGLNDPAVAGILALSNNNVFALGSGNTEDEGGPLVVLHYNGHKWTRFAQGQFGSGPNPQFSYDGNGGLWLPMLGASGGTGYLVHYFNGRLTKAALPVAAAKITVSAVARVPGSTAQIAGGFTHTAGNLGGNVVGVVLKY
ncbi:MAG: hypothetical protein ABSA02_17615 [Trebonia sp.]|jgi:hypothetical protein